MDTRWSQQEVVQVAPPAGDVNRSRSGVSEMAIALDEVIGTGEIHGAEVRWEPDPDGIVPLRWWQGQSWSL